MDIKKLIGETTEYDKKLTLEERKPKSWLKSVSAFANTDGGVLIFGVAKDDTPVGVDDPQYIAEKISEQINDRMDPVPEINLQINSESGKQFVVLKVSAGEETPYYYSGDGSHVAYIRIGNESVPAKAVDLKRLVLKGTNKSFDSLETMTPFEGVAFTKLRSVYKQRTHQEFTPEDFVSFGLVTDNGMLTNAGLLLADGPMVRHSRVFCTRWNGLTKASGLMDALDDREFEGSLVSLLQDTMQFVRNNTKVRWRKEATERIEMPEYSERSVEESIVNGLIHRDYLILGSEVHVDIFDDRMEIYSPGGMFDGSLVQDLDLNRVPSARRNPVIADLFHRMHYMERRGSGFKKIRESYEYLANYVPDRAPVFHSSRTDFWVTLYNLNYNIPIEQAIDDSKKLHSASEKPHSGIKKLHPVSEKLHSEENKASFNTMILAMRLSKPTMNKIMSLHEEFGDEGAFSRFDIVDMFNIQKRAASDLINKMKDLNLIEPVFGQGQGKYKFKE